MKELKIYQNNLKKQLGTLVLATAITTSSVAMIGCSKYEKDEFAELNDIYSKGNTYLSEDNRNKYLFKRENIRCFQEDDGWIDVIIMIDDSVSGYIVLPRGDDHYCIPVDSGLSHNSSIRPGNYISLDEILNEEEKEKDSFYIEELVNISKRANKLTTEVDYPEKSDENINENMSEYTRVKTKRI